MNLEDQAFNLRDEGRVYLDHNATTPVCAALIPHIQNWIEAWGNPSSIHQSGRKPKALMREARQNLANAFGVSQLELIFTSGGSESNNLVLKSVVESEMEKESPRRTLIISDVEHPAIRVTAEYLTQKYDLKLLKIPVNRDGLMEVAFYDKALSDDVLLVSVMTANNETGHIFPIKSLAKKAHDVGALFHTDAVQALGKLEVNLKDWDVDFASFSGHKFYALKGSGLLYVKKGNAFPSQIFGGGQERHRRAGTENTLAIASLGFMATQLDQLNERSEEMQKLRDSLESQIVEKITGVRITGAGNPRLPNVSSMKIEDIDGETLLMNLDIEGYSVSTGAACSSGNPEPSPVLLAMGFSRAEAQSSMRIGLGWGNTQEEIDGFVTSLEKVVTRVRSLSGGVSGG